jgi:hypothetical protein
MLARATARVLFLSGHSTFVSTASAVGAIGTMSTLPPNPSKVEFDFPLSSKPKNPLGEGKYIKTAAALIIGFVFLTRTNFICV